MPATCLCDRHENCAQDLMIYQSTGPPRPRDAMEMMDGLPIMKIADTFRPATTVEREVEKPVLQMSFEKDQIEPREQIPRCLCRNVFN